MKPSGSKILQLKSVLFLLILLLSLVGQLLFSVSITHAQNQPSPGSNESRNTVMQYEGLRMLLQGKSRNSSGDASDLWCSGVSRQTSSGGNEISANEIPLDESLTKAEYENEQFSILSKTEARENDRDGFPVPATLFGEGNNSISCWTALGYYYKFKYSGASDAEKRKALIADYYDIKHLDDIVLKEGAQARLWRDTRAWMLGLIQSRSSEFLVWRDYIINQMFVGCYEWNRGDIKSPGEASDAIRYDHESWSRKSGSVDVQPVGYMVESEVEDAYIDGRVSCEQVKRYVLDDHRNLLVFDGSAAADTLLRNSQRNNIVGMFLANDTHLRNCINSYGTAALKSATGSRYLELLADWLIDGGDTELTSNAQARSSHVYVSQGNSQNMSLCLIAGYGDPLLNELKRTSDEYDTERITDDGDDGAPAADDCDFSMENGILGKIKSVASGQAISGALKWFVCSVAKGLNDMFMRLADGIGNALETEVVTENQQLRDAWSRFMRIAMSLLIIAFLIMVISTALGFGFFDAYTVKKLLPRIIIAAVLAALSYELCAILIRITNDIGDGMETIIRSASGGPSFRVDNESLAALMVGGGIGTVAVIGTAGFILIPMLVSVLSALLTAYAVIVIRRILIVLLVVLAPVAIILWAMPGGENIAKRWFKTFVQLLFAYPFIIAILYSGQFVASMAAQTEGFFGFFVRFGVTILPFFMLPAVFKMASGTLGTITGMVNDRSKGLADRARNASREHSKKNWQKAKAGSLYTRPGFRSLNKPLASVQTGFRGHFGLGQRGEAARSANMREGATALMSTENWKQIQHDDNAMRAATYRDANAARAGMMAEGMSADEADRAIAKVRSTVGFGAQNQVAAAQQMLLNKTAYRDSADVAATIARASGGNADAAESLRGFNNAYAKQVGRHDLSAVSRDAIELASDPTATQAQIAAEGRRNTIAGFKNADTFTLGRENSASYVNMADAHAAEYHDAVAAYIANPHNVNRERVVAARTGLEEIIKNANSATGNNAETAVELANYIGADDAVLRAGTADGGTSILGAPVTRRAGQGDSQGAVGEGGLARAPRQLSDAERRAYEAQQHTDDN